MQLQVYTKVSRRASAIPLLLIIKDPEFNLEYLDLDLVVVRLTKCVISVYLSYLGC